MFGKNQEKIAKKVEEILKSHEAELVEFKIFGSEAKPTLRCLADGKNCPITIEQCAKFNRLICSFLEETKLLGDGFTVEINSPGIDRKLKTRRDFSKVIGKIICLWLKEKVIDKTYLEGVLITAVDDKLTLKIKDNILSINLDNIITGKEKIC